MPKKYITYLILFLLLVITSCKNNFIDEVNRRKIDIDKYPITEHLIRIEIDSLGNHLDTISFTKIKKDLNGDVLFREYKIMDKYGELKSQEYYQNNDLIFMSNLSYNGLDESLSYFEQNENGLIINGISFMSDTETKKIDTIQYKVDYEFNENGKKRKIQFHQTDDSTKLINEVYFDNNENIIFEIEYDDSDTISHTRYEYLDTLLINKNRIVKFGKGKKTITYYDKNELPIRIESYDLIKNDSILIEEKIYKNTLDGKHKSVIFIDHKKDKERLIKFEYIKISGT